MSRIKTGFTVVMLFFTLTLFSQPKDSLKIHLNHYSFNLGVGWNHYFNNLEYGDQQIQKNFAGITLKFFWEPEYLLSMGMETGFYKLFKVTNTTANGATIIVNRTVIPFLLIGRMRIVNNFYLGTGMGLAIIYNKASGENEKIITQTTSLSNYEISGSYIFPLGKYWHVGGEVKVFNFGNLNDWMSSVQAICSIRL